MNFSILRISVGAQDSFQKPFQLRLKKKSNQKLQKIKVEHKILTHFVL